MLTFRKVVFLVCFSVYFSSLLMGMSNIVEKIRSNADIKEIKKAVQVCPDPGSSAAAVLGIVGFDSSLKNDVIDLLVNRATNKHLRDAFSPIPSDMNAYARQKIKKRLKSYKKSDPAPIETGSKNESEFIKRDNEVVGTAVDSESRAAADESNPPTEIADTVQIRFHQPVNNLTSKKSISLLTCVKWGSMCALLGYACYYLTTSKVTKQRKR